MAICRKHRAGFTLVELLLAFGVIAVLGTLLVPAMASVRQRAHTAREAAAGSQLGRGFLLAAESNGGRLLEGYHTGITARRRDGAAIYGPAAARYPWRLAPYFDYQFLGTMYVNVASGDFDASDEYMVSLKPSFGINAYCVGGYNDGSGSYQVDVLRRLSESHQGSRLVAFASSRMTPSESESFSGNHLVTPPRIGGMSWSGRPSRQASSTGNVDFRHDDHAMVVFLDGHVDLMDIDELRDMRLWSPGAQKADNPNYSIPASAPTTVNGPRRR